MDVSISHTAPMPGSLMAFGSLPLTQGMDVGNSHLAPIPSSQTPIWNIEAGIHLTAPMTSSQPLIPINGLNQGKTAPSFKVLGFGIIQTYSMSSQTHIRNVEAKLLSEMSRLSYGNHAQRCGLGHGKVASV
ncbi:hypothetical protein E2C01_071172 [Portunus trituberculatus]|uniref:Uncharacterized protein n=1 Tax=Portunus trituberculatus TaxID=210409 RepID=A0A5B7I7J1_PORTR|nr:hypothetical protein [Portunus trituberculatus]